MFWAGTGCELSPDAGVDSGAEDTGDDVLLADVGTDARMCERDVECEGANAVVECEAGVCVLESCNDGFADCNDEPADGCETPLETDTDNCGSCGTACGEIGCLEGLCQDPVASVSLYRATSTEANGCAVTTTGRLYCWGNNAFGQLPGALEETTAFAPVEIGADFTSAECGSRYCCGVKRDRSVRCWGYDASGRLGDGATDSTDAGFVRPDVSDISSISVGSVTACARDLSTLWCWGLDLGAAAGGEVVINHSPVLIGSRVETASVGLGHACYVSSSSSLSCWGLNNSGQLGDASIPGAERPTNITRLNVESVQSGLDHTCVTLEGGGVSCWGLATPGGRGFLTPTDVPSLAGVERLFPGRFQTCGLVGGSVQCVGTYFDDSAPDGVAISLDARDVGAPADVADFVEANGSYCAVTSSGALYCWGDNSVGQLGIGAMSDDPELEPVRVRFPVPSSE